MSQRMGADGWTVFVLPSSHNDIGWAGTPSEIAEHRANRIVNRVLAIMEDEDDYAFCIEAALYLREFEDRYPERIPLLQRFLKERRLECGGSYIQPYEGLLSGESLIRQFEFGRKWVHERLGVPVGGYWNIDVAGRTHQLPQILNETGVRYMVLSRNKPGIYWWEAPDGTRTLTISLFEGSYGHAPVLKPLSHHVSPLDAANQYAVSEAVPTSQIADRLIPLLKRWEPYFATRGLPRIFLITATADYAVPEKQVREFLEKWNMEAESGELRLPFPVELKFGNVEQYFAALEARTDFGQLDVVRGELPNPWIYIHGPCHAKTVNAMRAAQEWLVAAEALEVIDGQIDVDGQTQLERAWLAHLYPDHGYGGLHGEGTDELFRQKEEEALYTARFVASDRMESVAGRVAGHTADIRTLVVFNPSGMDRTGWTETELHFQPDERIGFFRLAQTDGDPIEFHVLEERQGADGALLRSRIGFIAADVPAWGYRAYRLIPAATSPLPVQPTTLNARVTGDFLWENAYYRARVTKGGLVEYFDKRVGRNLLAPDHYLGFEIVEMASPGHDVGEGERDLAHYIWDAVRPFQPAAIGVERTGDRGASLELLEDGPLRSRIRTESAFTNCRIAQTFTFYRELDHMEVTVEIGQWNGVHGRELRLMFPVGEPDAEISYDVPFGHVVVGESEFPGFADLRPREAYSWIHARGVHTRVTMGSSVIAHDWVDPLGLTERPVLQAILLATKRSCHPKGPWYTQEGDHTFHLVLGGGPDTLADRHRFGLAIRRPMSTAATSANSCSSETELPELASMFGIDAANVVISSVRLQEDGNGALIRCWECEGRPGIGTLRSRNAVTALRSCNALGEDRSTLWTSTNPDNEIPLELGPNQIATFALDFANSVH